MSNENFTKTNRANEKFIIDIILLITPQPTNELSLSFEKYLFIFHISGCLHTCEQLDLLR